MRRLSAALGMVLAVSAFAADKAPKKASPPMPYTEDGYCPGECCGFNQAWVYEGEKPAIVRAEHDLRSPELFRVKPREELTALTGFNIISRLQVWRARRALDLGQEIKVARGAQVQVIRAESEGFYLVWHEGAAASLALENACPPNETCWDVVQKGAETWWVKVKNAAGKVGWMLGADLRRVSDSC